MRNDWFLGRGLVWPALILLFTGCASGPETAQRSPAATRQLQCLAEAIHGEARGEPEDGKIFVGRVVITRVRSGYGPNYCSVVYAKRQFAPKKKPSKSSYAAAVKSERLGPNGVTHFHSYKQRRTPLAGFSRSPACDYKGKVGGHWAFTCTDGRAPAQKQASSD